MKTAAFCGTLLGISMCCGTAQTLLDPPKSPDLPFTIRDIKRATKGTALVDSAWKNNVPGIEVSIRTDEDHGMKKPYVRAYIYNRDKAIVAKHEKPTELSANGASSNIPDYLKPKATYRAFFGIPERAESGKDRWYRIIVVFGEGNRAVAEIYPADDIAAFDFPEKKFATTKKK